MKQLSYLNKRIAIIVAITLLVGLNVKSQVNYAFSADSGTYSTITGGKTIILSQSDAALGYLATDEGYNNNVAIGFNFYYNGSTTATTALKVNSNGFVALGSSFVANQDGYWYNNLTNGPSSSVGSILTASGYAARRPIIAPFWGDLDIVTAANLRYKLTGTAPNRVFTLEWANVLWDYQATGSVLNVELILHETTNVIEFQYKSGSTAPTSTAIASIGLTGTGIGIGKFLSLQDVSPNPIVSKINENRSIKTLPKDGQIYRFTPITPLTNDAVAYNLYPLGTMAKNGNSYSITSVVANIGSNVKTNIPVTLTISGANSYTKTITIPSLDSFKSAYLTFTGYTPTSVGVDQITLSVPNDQDNSNNTKTVQTMVTNNMVSTVYDVNKIRGTGVQANTFEAATRFYPSGSESINEVAVYFTTATYLDTTITPWIGQPFTLTIYDTTGTSGKPGNILWQHTGLISDSGRVVIPVSPSITATNGYYIGVKQTDTNNIAVGYELENPLRPNTFYYDLGNGFVAAPNTYKFMVDVKYDVNKAIIDSFTPSKASSGTAVIIKGKYFTGGTAVSFGGTPAIFFSIVDDSTIIAIVGNGSSGDVIVVTALGTTSKAGFSFCQKAITSKINLIGCDSITYKAVKYFASAFIYDTVKASQGCDSIINEVTITINSIANFNPFQDSTIINTTFSTLNGGNGFVKYKWNTGDTTQSITVSQSGWYKLTVTNSNGCTAMDSTYLILKSVNGIGGAGSFVVLSNLGSLYLVNSTNCTSTLLNFCTNFTGNPLSIAIDGSTLYIVDSKGYLYKNTIVSTGTIGNCTKIGQFLSKSTVIYGLTVGPGGIVYAASSNLIETYNPTTTSFATIGAIPANYVIAGDLYFYNGKLFESVINSGNSYALIQVNLSNPSLSNIYINYNAGLKVSGLAAVEVPCSNNQLYAISSNSNTTDIYALDMINKVQSSTSTCKLNYVVSDAASIAETQSNSFISPVTNTFQFNDCNSVLYNSTIYSSSTVFTDTVKSNSGCDSIYNKVNITISNNAISGNIVHPNKKGLLIPNVKTVLSGNKSDTVIGLNNYSFNCLPLLGNYNIRNYKNNDITKANGISTIDAALLQSHVLGKLLLNSPYKIIAADVNGDGKVSALDIVLIKRQILGLDTAFTKTTTGEKRLWAFVDSSYHFPDTTNPFPYKDSISFTGLSASKTNQTFIGMKLGDVNWDWNPAVAKPINNTINAVELSYSSEAIKTSDGYIRIPIKVKNFKEMMGMQFTLGFNVEAMTFKGIEHNLLNIEIGTNHLTEGKISMLWLDPKNEVKTLEDGTMAFELVFENTGKEAIGKEAIGIQNTLSLDGSITTIEAFDKDYTLHGIVMKPSVINVPVITQESWVVAPNPTTDGVIHVQMNLKEHKTIVFQLVDIAGKVILSKKQIGEKGSNNFTLFPSMHVSEGMYFLKAEGVEGVKQLRIN